MISKYSIFQNRIKTRFFFIVEGERKDTQSPSILIRKPTFTALECGKGRDEENLYIVKIIKECGQLWTEIYITMENDRNTAKLVAVADGDKPITRALLLCVDACEGWLGEDDVFKFYGVWESAEEVS